MSEVEQLILMTKGLKLHPLEEYIGIWFEIVGSEDIRAKFTMRDDLCGYPGGGVIPVSYTHLTLPTILLV